VDLKTFGTHYHTPDVSGIVGQNITALEMINDILLDALSGPSPLTGPTAANLLKELKEHFISEVGDQWTTQITNSSAVPLTINLPGFTPGSLTVLPGTTITPTFEILSVSPPLYAIKYTGGGGVGTAIGANLGAGAQVYAGNVGSTLQFRTIQAGSNVIVVQAANDITVSTVLTSWTFMDLEASGTAAGGSIIGLQPGPRVLNFSIPNGPNAGNVLLAGNQLTFAPGTYTFSAYAPAYLSGFHRLQLTEVSPTPGNILIIGAGAYSLDATAETTAYLSGQLFVTAVTVCKLDHYCSAAQAVDGLGRPVSQAGVQEVYATVNILELR